MHGHQGRTIRCGQCGGPFEITVLVDSVRCPYCHRVQGVAPELVEELRRYEAEVAEQLRQATVHAGHVQALDEWQRASPLQMLLPLLCIGIATLGTLAAFLGAWSLGIGPPRWEPYVGLSAVLGPMLGIAIWVAIQVPIVLFSKKRQRKVTFEGVKVSCPNCGAPGALTPGDSVDSCQSCRAALAPGATAILAAVSQASRQRRALRIEHYKKERAQHARMVPLQDMSTWMLYGILGFNVIAPLGIFLGGALEALVKPGFDEYGVLVFAGLWFVVALLGGLGLVLWRSRHRKAVHEAMADLARQFRGESSRDWAFAERWLDAYWAGPYPLADRQVGYYFTSLGCRVHGYPTLLEVNLSGSKGERPRVTVRVATAEAEPDTPAREGVHTELGWLRHLGFSVEESEAGLLAEASPAVVKRVRSVPAALHGVAPVLGHLSRLAQHRGRAPVEPLS